MTAKQKQILYIDDDEDDRELLTEALIHADEDISITYALHGLEAIQYLVRIKSEGGMLPSLIILDINMPFLDGKETFEKLVQDEVFRTIPVVIFSSSEKPADKLLFNNRGVRFYTKPSNLVYMREIVEDMLRVCFKLQQ